MTGLGLATRAQDTATSNPPSAVVIGISGAIGPATSDYFTRTLDNAAGRGARLFLVEMDTPGGLDTAMRDMIQAILASRIPVVIFVAPSGARAASAGTYLLYASHVAAMAPATNLGAATPVNITGSPPPGRDQEPREPGAAESEETQPSPGTAMERKAVNDAIAYIRGLAELRGRNVEWAEAAVRTAASLSSAEALAQNVIDIVATDVADLLKQIDGRTVQTADGSVTLSTTNLVLERIEPDWRTNLLATITNPNVAYILMLIGIYGLLLEGYNPGAIVPGVTGAICLLLALFAFQLLPVNYAGIGLMLLGLLLLIAEAFVPSFGALGLGGIISFVIGSIMLLDTDVPGFTISRPLVGTVALVGAIGTLGIATYFVRSRRQPVVTGSEQLLHEVATAIADFDREGMVKVRGELWLAHTRTPVKAGQRLRIIRVDGLRLEVDPAQESSS